MSIATVSVIIAAASVVGASIFYSFQIRSQTRLRRADLLLRLYTTWDFTDCDSYLEHFEGRRHVGTYVATFYDQVGALLRRDLIDYDLVDDLLGNSAIELWKRSGTSSPKRGRARTIRGSTSTSSSSTTR